MHVDYMWYHKGATVYLSLILLFNQGFFPISIYSHRAIVVVSLTSMDPQGRVRYMHKQGKT